MTVHLSALNDVQEVLYNVFTFCSPQENIENTKVCKTWYQVASEVAKKQIIISAQADILRKASNFLKLVPQDLAFYCPSFAELEKAKLNFKNYSIKEINKKVQAATEKYTVCIASFYTVNSACPNIPREKKADLAGKTFVELHFENDSYIVDKSDLWGEKCISYSGRIDLFPIEIFDLTVNNKDNAIVGEKNDGTYCFALRGRLFELKLEEGKESVRNADWISWNMSRENALIVDLTPDDVQVGQFWSCDFYVARLDAAGSTINSNN
jgi:hypothetical protein